MIALIKGAGRLPELVAENLTRAGTPPVICALDPSEDAHHHVTLGTLGSLLNKLRAAGVTGICMAGALDRANLMIDTPDAETLPLVPKLKLALFSGDNQALSRLHDLLEEEGFKVHAAHELCPELLPDTGCPTKVKPNGLDEVDTNKSAETLSIIGKADFGQGCVVERGQVLAVETLPGTNTMLKQVAAFRKGQGWDRGGVFYKAPKPDQDLRTDMPVIGPETARYAIAAGLAGIVIEAGNVMVLDLPEVIERLDEAGLFLWVRPA